MCEHVFMGRRKNQCLDFSVHLFVCPRCVMWDCACVCVSTVYVNVREAGCVFARAS